MSYMQYIGSLTKNKYQLSDIRTTATTSRQEFHVVIISAELISDNNIPSAVSKPMMCFAC